MNKETVKKVIEMGLWGANFLTKFTKTDVDDQVVRFIESNKDFIVEFIFKIMDLYGPDKELSLEEFSVLLNSMSGLVKE